METKETGLTLLKKELPQLKAIVGINRKENTEAVVLQELEYLQSIMLSKPDLEQCLPVSIVSAVKSVMKQNLSLDPSAGLVYVKTRNLKVNNAWVKVLEIQPSANGLISIARQSGRLIDLDRPKIERNAEGKVIGVKFRYLVPTINADGSKGARWKEDEFDESDFERWRIASHREKSNGKEDAGSKDYSNRLYTSWKGGIDPEFARAKAIRHSGLKKSGINQNEIALTFPSLPQQQPIINAAIEEHDFDDFEIMDQQPEAHISTENKLKETVAKIKANPVVQTIPNSDEL